MTNGYDASHLIQIREVTSIEDCGRVQQLASLVWGEGAACSKAQMSVHAHYGGVVLLAYVQGEPAGFLFSFPALYRNETVLWSHEAAVVPGHQDMGIGMRLKLRQREIARVIGYRHIAWTYDPLVSRNAYFNLNKLGARVVEYKENAYGVDKNDRVNQGIETDRFIVLWDTEDGRSERPLDFDEVDFTCVLQAVDGLPRTMPSGDASNHLIETQIPADFSVLLAGNSHKAKSWRFAFRDAASNLFGRGFAPIHYQKKSNNPYGSYFWVKSGGTI